MQYAPINILPHYIRSYILCAMIRNGMLKRRDLPLLIWGFFGLHMWSTPSPKYALFLWDVFFFLCLFIYIYTWGRGWMTKASGVGERRKGRGELRRDCHHRVAALFVPTRMQQWYIDIWYITMIYMGEGAGGALSREKSGDVLGEPRNTC